MGSAHQSDYPKVRRLISPTTHSTALRKVRFRVRLRVRATYSKSEKWEVGLMDAKIKKCMVGELGSRTDVMRPQRLFLMFVVDSVFFFCTML